VQVAPKRAASAVINVYTINTVHITYDPVKRELTLRERGLDFEDAREVFARSKIQTEDQRYAYGERRFVTLGLLRKKLAVVVWTPRPEGRRIISMRYANEREINRSQFNLG
jgi:uncharacterized protein